MAYVSLYRKYRPQTFKDVVGQEHVTVTLRNAIQAGRVASGYLFTGTRGTAKTTCARILAKALNCIGADGKNTSPTPEPCGVCGPCRSIASSSFVDVLEMDAASHGKVDDVRDLVASIKFPPMEGRYKVYIIDEAHQLSRDAMDAFLKTLEEPPDRVVFVLATTELDKLPITIASRCQVYEFKRGSVTQIASRLNEVLKTEGVKADAAAVTLIARAADGSYRDSLSLLEQVLAFQREHVTAKDVTAVLGTIDDDLLTQVVGLIADSDAAGAFALAGTVLESGKDVRQFLKSLAERFRDMLFVGVGARPASAGEIDDSASLRAQAARFAPASLLHALEVLTSAEQETKRSNQHRLLLEMALLRLMRLPTTALASPPVPLITLPAVVSPPNGAAIKVEASREIPYDIPPPLAEVEMAEVEALLPGDDELDMLPLGDNDEADALPSLVLVSSEQAEEQMEDLLHIQQVIGTEPVAPARPVLLPDAPPELRRLQKSWREVVNLTGATSKTAAKDVEAAEPVDISGNVILLEFSHSFHFDRVQSKEALRHCIEENICKTLEVPPGSYRTKCIMKGQALPQRSHAIQKAAADAPGPFVEKVIAVFGGQLLEDDAKG